MIVKGKNFPLMMTKIFQGIKINISLHFHSSIFHGPPDGSVNFQDVRVLYFLSAFFKKNKNRNDFF